MGLVLFAGGSFCSRDGPVRWRSPPGSWWDGARPPAKRVWGHRVSPRLCHTKGVLWALILAPCPHRGIKQANGNQFIGELEGGRRNRFPSEARSRRLGVVLVPSEMSTGGGRELC